MVSLFLDKFDVVKVTVFTHGSRYRLGMIMHDGVVMLCYYMDVLMIIHVHANVD